MGFKTPISAHLDWIFFKPDTEIPIFGIPMPTPWLQTNAHTTCLAAHVKRRHCPDDHDLVLDGPSALISRKSPRVIVGRVILVEYLSFRHAFLELQERDLSLVLKCLQIESRFYILRIGS